MYLLLFEELYIYILMRRIETCPYPQWDLPYWLIRVLGEIMDVLFLRLMCKREINEDIAKLNTISCTGGSQ